MKIHSDLLMTLARASGAPDLEVSDQALGIPPFINPTVELLGALGEATGFSVTDPQRTSFIAVSLLSRAASQASTAAVVCTFGKGLWRVHLMHRLLSNFTQASDGTAGLNQSTLDFTAGAIRGLSRLFDVTAVPQYHIETFRLLLASDGWFINHGLAATGVGQTHQADVIVKAERLSS